MLPVRAPGLGAPGRARGRAGAGAATTCRPGAEGREGGAHSRRSGARWWGQAWRGRRRGGGGATTMKEQEVLVFRRVNSGGECGAPRGMGGGMHGVRGASGDVRVRGPGFPSDLRPRAPPLAPLVHPPGAGGLWGNEIWFGRRSGRSAAGTVLGGGGRGEGRLWRVDRDLSSPLIPPPGRFARTTPPSSQVNRDICDLYSGQGWGPDSPPFGAQFIGGGRGGGGDSGGGGGLSARIGGLSILRRRPSPNPGDGGRWGPDLGRGGSNSATGTLPDWQSSLRLCRCGSPG